MTDSICCQDLKSNWSTTLLQVKIPDSNKAYKAPRAIIILWLQCTSLLARFVFMACDLLTEHLLVASLLESGILIFRYQKETETNIQENG